jgi:hypothetical protein
MRSVVRRNAGALAAAALAVAAAVAGLAAERSYTGGNFEADGFVQVPVTEPGGTSLITEVGFPALARHEHGPENFQTK